MTRNRITVTGDHLVVEPQGLDKVWSFTRRIEIPLAHVEGAFFDPSVITRPIGWRFPGLRVPGKVSGTFYSEGKKTFWNTAGDDRAITIGLRTGERFDQLILSVDVPLADVDRINRAINR